MADGSSATVGFRPIHHKKTYGLETDVAGIRSKESVNKKTKTKTNKPKKNRHSNGPEK